MLQVDADRAVALPSLPPLRCHSSDCVAGTLGSSAQSSTEHAWRRPRACRPAQPSALRPCRPAPGRCGAAGCPGAPSAGHTARQQRPDVRQRCGRNSLAARRAAGAPAPQPVRGGLARAGPLAGGVAAVPPRRRVAAAGADRGRDAGPAQDADVVRSRHGLVNHEVGRHDGRRRLDTGQHELRGAHAMCPRAPDAATTCTEAADEPLFHAYSHERVSRILNARLPTRIEQKADRRAEPEGLPLAQSVIRGTTDAPSSGGQQRSSNSACLSRSVWCR